ncbi:hypothetical protein BHE74_00030187 [Ensete ventricosum]|nr:hypothetical protein BHE74_00030187 [Ensete ventricosum]
MIYTVKNVKRKGFGLAAAAAAAGDVERRIATIGRLLIGDPERVLDCEIPTALRLTIPIPDRCGKDWSVFRQRKDQEELEAQEDSGIHWRRDRQEVERRGRGRR